MISFVIRLIRYLLFPFSLLYGLVVLSRNFLYDRGVFSSYRSAIPVISIGNLAAGGTGKSPVAALISRMLAGQFRVAVLSRGYGRNTSGFREVTVESTAGEVGDEPLQLKKQLPAITVAVDENRVNGIKILEPRTDVIILDDAYQHRAVQPGLNILLFDYAALGHSQWLLPTGNLREPLSFKKRAGLLLVTKTPEVMTAAERTAALVQLQPFPHQDVVFSWLGYEQLKTLDGRDGPFLRELENGEEVVLLTGIANPAPLIAEIEKNCVIRAHHKFADHHTYTSKNIAKLAISAGKHKIITTEKDAQRLLSPALKESVSRLLIYYLPVRAKIHREDESRFISSINNYVHSKYS